MDSTLLHICPRPDWVQAQAAGAYLPLSLREEGFIHLSTPAQIAGTARLFFEGQSNLVLLLIATEAIAKDLRWENTTGGEDLFPHLYAPLPLEAVLKVQDFAPGHDGRWQIEMPG
ncbi:MAG: DUF952 domain-containing protein [Microscillaceae bacterium]|nr:DUF952 domain-containing protein [Microscillaceae bacterium]